VDDDSKKRQPHWDPRTGNPEEATLQVWSSEHSYPGEMIEMALRENQIHGALRKSGWKKNAIFVWAEDEVRPAKL